MDIEGGRSESKVPFWGSCNKDSHGFGYVRGYPLCSSTYLPRLRTHHTETGRSPITPRGHHQTQRLLELRPWQQKWLSRAWTRKCEGCSKIPRPPWTLTLCDCMFGLWVQANEIQGCHTKHGRAVQVVVQSVRHVTSCTGKALPCAEKTYVYMYVQRRDYTDLLIDTREHTWSKALKHGPQTALQSNPEPQNT